MADSKRLDRAKSKALLAAGLGAAGAAAGAPLGPVGAAVGGGLGVLTGVIVGDQTMVFQLDYVAVPAYEYSGLLAGRAPTHSIYIKAGETLMPTGGNVDDYELGLVEAAVVAPIATKRKPTKYNRAYAKAFKSVAHRYKLKNGSWAKNGFSRAQKEAHRIAGGKN